MTNDIKIDNIENLWLPPGTLVYIGEKQVEKVKIAILEYNTDNYNDTILDDIEEFQHYKDNQTTKWINITGINNINTIEKIGNVFNINTLTLEDILDTNHMTKIEILEDYVFLIIKAFIYEDNNNILKSEQISILFNEHLLITFSETDVKYFDHIKERIKNSKGVARKYGTDYLAYSLLDAIVDKQFETLKVFDELAEDLEERVILNANQTILRCINDYKKDAIKLRQGFWPLRDMVNILQKIDAPIMNKYMNIYLRDLYDHSCQLIESLEMIRETISHMFDLYLTNVSNRLNEIMKVLAIISTIFMPLSFLVGLYGMNFKHFPGIEWEYSFYLLLCLMLFIVALMLIYFKKNKWF